MIANSTKLSAEVHELRLMLAQLPKDDSSQQRERRREVFKKLVGYMWLGVDMSGVFREVMLNCVTKDIVQKKLINIYLSEYASSSGEFSLLLVNTFLNDTRSSDPLIRGLALRSLTTMAHETEEFFEPMFQTALHDPSDYVQRIALISLLRLPNALQYSEQILKVVQKPSNKLGLVILGVMLMLHLDRTYIIEKPLIARFFNRLDECSSFEKSVCLTVIASYKPESEAQLYSLFEHLDKYLQCSNTSVFLNSVYSMLSLIRNSEASDFATLLSNNAANHIVVRACVSILTFLCTESQEVQFVLLSFLLRLLQFAPDETLLVSLRQITMQLVPWYLDSSQVCVLKMRLLLLLVHSEDALLCFNELVSNLALGHQTREVIAEFLYLSHKFVLLNTSVKDSVKSLLNTTDIYTSKYAAYLYFGLAALIKVDSCEEENAFEWPCLNSQFVSALDEISFVNLINCFYFSHDFATKYLSPISRIILERVFQEGTLSEQVLMQMLFVLVRCFLKCDCVQTCLESLLKSIETKFEQLSLGTRNNLLFVFRLIKSGNTDIISNFLSNSMQPMHSAAKANISFADLCYENYQAEKIHVAGIYETFDTKTFCLQEVPQNVI